jgi:hypothetical protein
MGIRKQIEEMVKAILTQGIIQLLRRLLEILAGNPGDDDGSDKPVQR